MVHTRSDWLGNARTVVGLIGAALLLFGTGWSNSFIYLGILLLFAATLLDLPAFLRWGLRSPAFWAVLLLSGYVLLRGLIAGPVAIADAKRLDATKDLLDIVGLPAMALGWCFARRPVFVPALLVTTSLGLVLGFLLNLNWTHLGDYLQLQRRLEIGLGGNGTSFFGGALMIGVLAYARSLVGYAGERAAARAWRGAGLLLLWLFGLELLLMGQTRTAWIATMGTIMFAGILWMHRAGFHEMLRLLRQYWGLFAVLAVVCVGLVAWVWEPVVARVTREAETWRQLGDLQFENLKQTSIGLRVTAWRIGFDAFLEHPWFGTGIGSASQVLAQSDIPIRRILSHFHSLYLQLLVTTGVVGFVLAGGMVTAFAREALRGTDLDRRSANVARFAGYSAVYFAIASLAIIRYDDPHGMAFVILLGGCALAPGMRRSLVEGEKGAVDRAPGTGGRTEG